jgi:hypothetical protein
MNDESKHRAEERRRKPMTAKNTENTEKPQPAVASSDWLACAWQEHDDGRYDTACDNAFEFTYGTPEDNDFKWCPFCGKSITIEVRRADPDLPT